MARIDALARAAGFRKSNEITTCSDSSKVDAFAGIDIIGSPLMPEGWIGMRTDKGVMCIGPEGKSVWVPAFELTDMLKVTYTAKEAE